jgi:hypothetical protein
MRSSPVYCLYDMTSFITSVFKRWSWGQDTLRHAYRHVLGQRFADGELYWDEKDIARTVLVRWMLILLGGIPCQTVKLLAMKGIPLTQTLAVVYFSALAFGEAISISATLSMQLLRARTSSASAKMPGFASFGHYLLMSLLPLQLLSAFWKYLVSRTSTIQFIMINLFLLTPAIALGQLRSRPRYWGPARLELMPVASYFGAGAGYYAWNYYNIFHPRLLDGIDPLDPPKSFLYTLLLAIYTLNCVTLAWAFEFGLVAMGKISRAIPVRLGSILGLPRSEEDQLMFVEFLWGLAVCVLGYAFLFDGTGTVNPSWTGVFG